MGEDEERGRVISLLGLAGESSELLSGYKKYLRDGDSYQLHPDKITEELGDTLWYLSATATRFGLRLSDIASKNLAKARERFKHSQPSVQRYFDEAFPTKERLPRQFEVEFRSVQTDRGATAELYYKGKRLGSPLRDNSYENDAYRFHDIFHLSYAAHLAWSPVTRYFFSVKRKTSTTIDEIEDGGRAIAVEEGLTAFIFGEAKARNFFADDTKVDYQILKAVLRMVSPFEVRIRTQRDWEQAILSGYMVLK